MQFKKKTAAKTSTTTNPSSSIRAVHCLHSHFKIFMGICCCMHCCHDTKSFI